MKRIALLFALGAAGCGGTGHAPPAADKAQVLVKLKAAPKEGVKGPKSESADAYSNTRNPEKGKRYQRVDYRNLADIAVMLIGPGLDDGGPAPRAVTLELEDGGCDHRLVLMAPGKRTQLTIVNRRSGKVTLFCGGSGSDGFDAALAPGASTVVTLSDPGTYEMTADEDECLKATILVAPSTWAALGESGEEVFFDNVPPGDYEVRVVAPRLPVSVRKVSAAAGSRAELEAEVSVNEMKTVK